jgi:hypothetical protein
MSREEGRFPRVFVSHASEDKVRFVLGFATRLLENGIDAWLDKWEMHPGDSLVDKIFDIGIGGAEAVLIVLSQNSVEKPWVREELNASIVERIKRGTKIIPIVLDNCAVPIALQSTVYVRIADPTHYDAELNSIVSTIYEHSEKPPLGSPPIYVQTPLERISGLKRIDSLLLKLAGEKAIEDCQRMMLTAEILSQATTLGVSRHDFYESLAVLGDKGYFELQRSSAQEPSEPELRSLTRGGVAKFSITLYGFEEYAKAYIPGYSSVTRGALLQIANYNKSDDVSIAEALHQPLMVVDHILDLLDAKGLIQLARAFGPVQHFLNPSPEIKRLLESSDEEV